MRRLFAAIFCTALSAGAFAASAPMSPEVAGIAHRWAKITYQTPGGEQEAAFKALADDAARLAAGAPDAAQPKVWEAIVLASYAKANGGLGALSAVKQARDLLLAAEKIDPDTLDGSVYTSLGSLYAKVPGWPIGFGSKDKARGYLETALAKNPNGIDANYFYGDLLADQGEYAKAAEHLRRALEAPPRPGREDADAGRRAEARALLDTLHNRHPEQVAAQ